MILPLEKLKPHQRLSEKAKLNRAAYKKCWTKANPKKIREYHQKWNSKNEQKNKEYAKKYMKIYRISYYLNNRDKIIEKGKLRHALNKEAYNSARRKYYAENPEKAKIYNKLYCKTPKGRAVRRLVRHKRRIAKGEGDVTSEQILFLMETQKECLKCGSDKRLEIDHIIPISKGGKHTITNLQILCRKCNATKSNKL